MRPPVILSNGCLLGTRYRGRARSALIAALRATRLTHRTIGCRFPLRTCRAFAAIASNCLSALNGPLRRVSACSAASLPRNVATQRRVVSSKAILRRRQACRLVQQHATRQRRSGLLRYCIACHQLTSIALQNVRSWPNCLTWSAVIPKQRPQSK